MKNRRITAVLALVSLAVALVGTGGAGAPAAHAQDESAGLIRVVHGIRGLVADIYLDGTLVLPTFQPERSTDPLAIPAGDHLIEIRAAGAAVTEAALLTQTVTVPAGFQGSLVAHLDQTGAPTLSVYADDLTPVPAGTSRLVVRHAAAAEDVNVLLNAEPALTDVAPGEGGLGGCPLGRLRDRGHGARRWRAARSSPERRVPRRHGQLHVPHRLRGRPHARLGGRPGRQPGKPPRRESKRAMAAPSSRLRTTMAPSSCWARRWQLWQVSSCTAGDRADSWADR